MEALLSRVVGILKFCMISYVKNLVTISLGKVKKTVLSFKIKDLHKVKRGAVISMAHAMLITKV